MSSLYFAGLEGGATHSHLVLCNEKGDVVTEVEGPSTNHWIIGIPEVVKRIAKMVAEAKDQANIPQSTTLQSIGLSLSGCEQEATNKILAQEMRTKYPGLSKNYVVCSDTIGSIYTALPRGGMVVIAGTGSNAHLKNPDGTSFNCGGWGHFLSDEGSGFGIAHRAMKVVFDDKDNLETPPFNTDKVWSLIREHFSVKTRLDLLDHCYAKFDKSFFAMLCLKLAKAAHEGDEMSMKLFSDAGRSIAKSIIAMLPNVHPDLIEDGVCTVVCVGSVWKSYDLLKAGFCKEMDSHKIGFDLRFIQLTSSMALGAVYLAADDTDMVLPRDYTKNYSIFYTYNKNVSAVKMANGSIVNRITSSTANGITNGKEHSGTNGLGRA